MEWPLAKSEHAECPWPNVFSLVVTGVVLSSKHTDQFGLITHTAVCSWCYATSWLENAQMFGE